MLYILTADAKVHDLDASLATLLSRHPQWRCTPKLERLWELEAEDDITKVAARLPEGWAIRPMTYASIDPPGVSLRGLQARLAQLRQEKSERSKS